MKRYFTLFLLSPLFTLSIYAQEYLSGKMIKADKQEEQVFYDRTQINISAYVFQSVYKVLDKDKNPIYSITLTHDQLKSRLYIALKNEGAGAKGFTMEYDKETSGLIFSDRGNTDTSYSLTSPCHYLISFTDISRDFPVLHKIRTDKAVVLLLDPLSRIRLRMHREIVNKVPAVEKEISEPDPSFRAFYHLGAPDPMSEALYRARADLQKLKDDYIDSITAMRATIQKQIETRFKTNRVTADEKKYDGDLKRGVPQGKGLLIEKGNLYNGEFKKGEFEKGFAAIKNEDFEYLGEYASGKFEGLGWVKYANGSYLIGQFGNSNVVTGISLSKDQAGEIFFGRFQNNQRTGYGELRNVNGNLYYGEFENGKLIKGYSKEIDQFGYATYSIVESGVKSQANLPLAEAFFNTIVYAKN